MYDQHVRDVHDRQLDWRYVHDRRGASDRVCEGLVVPEEHQHHERNCNARLGERSEAFKTIVIVCQQAGNKLYPSAITIDGASAGTSLSAAGATTAGLSERGFADSLRGRRATSDPRTTSPTRTRPASTSRTPSRSGRRAP